MNKAILSIAVAMPTISLPAQVTVKSSGFMDTGENPDSLIEHMG